MAHGARVPQLAQRPLAAGAGALAVLPGGALGASPPQLLELQLHPPEVKCARGGNVDIQLASQNLYLYFNFLGGGLAQRTVIGILAKSINRN